jgi:hypothetical protein
MAASRVVKQKLRDFWKLGPLVWRDRKMLGVVRQVRAQRLTYLEPAALVELYEAVRRIETDGRPGIMIEAGVALGGSAVLLAAAKGEKRPLHLYDTFEMIPPPSPSDGPDAHQRYDTITTGKAVGIKGDHYYGYRDNLLDSVANTFSKFRLPPEENRVSFWKGYFQDTLVINEPVALAHIDCDWYDSVMWCLEQIVPNLVVGGTLVIDDYEAWSGCRKAVDAYFADQRESFSFAMQSRLHIARLR